MLSKKTVFTALILFSICFSILYAGDTAVFVDLGFSPDGRTYMFGQYGVLAPPSLRPWAELFVVDVASNTFVQNGRVSHTENTPINAGQDGSGTLYRLLASNSSLTTRYSINHQNQGLPLYISRDVNPPTRGERIEFRDFISGRSFVAQLIPTITGTGIGVRSSFYINLEVRSSTGQVRTYTVGTPSVIRQRIEQYNIKRVFLDPTGTSIVFVIEMKRVADNNSHDIRYMVEVLRF